MRNLRLPPGFRDFTRPAGQGDRRPAPRLCEVCRTWWPERALAFPSGPRARALGLPVHLAGEVIFVCRDASCARAAEERARRAAAGYGIALPALDRLVFDFAAWAARHDWPASFLRP